MTEPTTGKITDAIKDEGPDGTVTTQHGEFRRWLVTIDAAGKTVKTSILRKPDSPSPFGQPAEYVNNRWKLAPPPQGGGGFKGGSGGKYEADPKKVRREAYGSALHAAIQLASVKGKTDVSSADVIRVADEFYEATMVKVDGPVGGS